MKLKDKVAIITGAGSGMGRAMAILFAEQGAQVVAAEWHQETLDETVSEITLSGGQITGVQGDISKIEDCARILETTVSSFGRLNVLVNNAGVMDNNHPIGSVDDATLERVLGINLYGTMYMTRASIAHLENAGGGSIVNIASVAGTAGGVAGVAYTVSKHGILGLTKNTAWMYAPKGIRCNAILPGAVATNIQNSMDMAKVDPIGSERLNLTYTLIPGTLEPSDIANLALFLASDDSRYINGACIPADGGWQAS